LHVTSVDVDNLLVSSFMIMTQISVGMWCALYCNAAGCLLDSEVFCVSYSTYCRDTAL